MRFRAIALMAATVLLPIAAHGQAQMPPQSPQQQMPPGAPKAPAGQQMTVLAYEQLRLGIEQVIEEHRVSLAAAQRELAATQRELAAAQLAAQQRAADLEAYGKACGDARGCWVPVRAEP